MHITLLMYFWFDILASSKNNLHNKKKGKTKTKQTEYEKDARSCFSVDAALAHVPLRD